MSTPDDLLRLVAKGDEGAFERLYDQVAPRVYGLARRVLRDPAQAEEVAQEALVDVWRLAARFDPARASAISWIMTLTHRRAVDRVRSSQSRTERENRVAAGQGEIPFDDVTEETLGRLERQQLRRCLRTLSELQRESIALAFYGGLTYPQVAATLDVALGTVKTRMRDGLIRLRDCLEVRR
ncbi:ECF RNA polymerase sigma factor SigK [Phytomonospora endophytica]|uniref:RNA polymerase sigma-70 factor (ECF subfamily) n=1 Tax=Phytomonospora endophytica TaxID=714109 RepID=A0A841FU28_9ACTN|nr:ECF RNA polymerase sigma factor SigK [Phytomonospora endophytica]MBB6037052.1 RNA polymerase sigma-70 factor (ECF subfamily) [Phytomonospora endophytica]GIG69405.1 RNA polymerase sigma factor SigK [Phytomonospora endophytica]